TYGVSILLGNGNGTFRPRTDSVVGDPSGYRKCRLAMADPNGDGNLDLAVASGISGGDCSVSIYQGNGDGTFQILPDSPLWPGGGAPAALIVAELNGDGKQDLAVAIGEHIVKGDQCRAGLWFLPDIGDGTFGTYRAGTVYDEGYTPGVAFDMGWQTGWASEGMISADLDADGKQDLIVTDQIESISGCDTLRVFWGDWRTPKGGILGWPSNYLPAAFSLGRPAAADLNRDGRLDLAVASSAGAVSIYLNDGLGNLNNYQNYAIGPAGALAVADVNGDGNLDLVTARLPFGVSTLSILLGNGDGTFQDCSKAFPAGSSATSILMADFNADQVADIAALDGGYLGKHVSILLGNSDWTFQPPVDYGYIDYPSSFVAGDFNSDAKVDLAVLTDFPSGLGLLTILLGNGDGTFQDYDPPTYQGYYWGDRLTSADFNADGKPDLATAGVVLLCNGDGTFQIVEDGVGSSSVVVDLNGDGKLDWVTAQGSDYSFYVCLGKAMTQRRNPTRSLSPTSMATGNRT
ncbi:MAG: VCBS repeat-containing protein, partial [Candidatus Aureabacteria bacterium]|nr:VCBS repeat-containing protein [Candidatus Auribacterota bacterium]